MASIVSKTSCIFMLCISIMVCSIITFFDFSDQFDGFTSFLNYSEMENTNSSEASNVLNIITNHTTLSPIILNINNKNSIQPKLNNTQFESLITTTLKPAHIISTQHQSSIIKTPISKLDLLNAIQEIEFSIYLDQISSISEYNNSIFSTGLSPHHYDGPFSLQKTCKQMRFRYLCSPYI
eukprot:418046_1